MNDRANEESVARGDAWEQCTAQGSRLQTLRHFKALSFIEKIEWLEEAEEIALRFRACRAGDMGSDPCAGPSR